MEDPVHIYYLVELLLIIFTIIYCLLLRKIKNYF